MTAELLNAQTTNKLPHSTNFVFSKQKNALWIYLVSSVSVSSHKISKHNIKIHILRIGHMSCVTRRCSFLTFSKLLFGVRNDKAHTQVRKFKLIMSFCFRLHVWRQSAHCKWKSHKLQSRMIWVILRISGRPRSANDLAVLESEKVNNSNFEFLN